MIRVVELSRSITKDGFRVVYRYWDEDKCACTAERVTRTFEKKPTTEDLINAI